MADLLPHQKVPSVNGSRDLHIWLEDNKVEEKVLRQRTSLVNLNKVDKKAMKKTLAEMRRLTKEANGVGLSANQVGLSQRFFIAEFNSKYYVIFNPNLKKQGEAVELEEGCLSTPNRWGIVKRNDKVILEGYALDGKKIKIKAWGTLAQIFQHEVDHLEGHLFIDKAIGLQTSE